MFVGFLVIGAIFAIPIGLVFFIQQQRAAGHREAQLRVWAPLAAQRGGQLIQRQGSFAHHVMGLPGPVPGSQIEVDVQNGIVLDSVVSQQVVNPGGWHTHIRMNALVPTPPYVLHGHERDRAARLLPPASLAWFPYLGPEATIASGGRVVTVVLPGVTLLEAPLRAAIEIVAELAARGPLRVT